MSGQGGDRAEQAHGTGERAEHTTFVGDEADLGIEGLTEVTVIGSGGSSTVYRARQEACLLHTSDAADD